jgi:TATA-box binding protein (TBP) (component of TFIID and TFIIIB)
MTTYIVAHLEYFMNTLNYDLKSKTENPFYNPSRYPALQYRLMEDGISSEAIIESKNEITDSSSSNESDEQEEDNDDLID